MPSTPTTLPQISPRTPGLAAAEHPPVIDHRLSGVGVGAQTIEEACFRKGHAQAEADMMAGMEKAVNEAEAAHQTAVAAQAQKGDLTKKLAEVEAKIVATQDRIHVAEEGLKSLDADAIPDSDGHDVSKEEKARREEGRARLKEEARLAVQKQEEQHAFLQAMRASKLEIGARPLQTHHDVQTHTVPRVRLTRRCVADSARGGDGPERGGFHPLLAMAHTMFMRRILQGGVVVHAKSGLSQQAGGAGGRRSPPPGEHN